MPPAAVSRPGTSGLLHFCTSALLLFSASCSFSPETTGSLVDCSNGKPCPEGWYCPSTEPKVCVQGALGGDEPGVTDTGTDLHKDGGPSDAAGQTDGGKPPEDAGDDAGSSETGVAGDFGWFDVGSYDGGPCGACDTPPQDVCLDNRHSRTYDRQGSCGAGDTCVYTSTDKECYYGCNNGLCIDCTPDCAGKECGDNGCGEACGMCDKAPADTCLSGTTVRDYDLTGTCTAGKCDYRYTDRVCQYGCAGGQCKGCQASCGGKQCGDDGCGGSCGTCNSPPGNSCVTTSTLRKYDAAGTCGGLSCSYGYTDQNCPYGCASNKCNPCPPSCAGKDCGDDGCGGSCGSCGSREICAGGTCGPYAVLIASQTSAPAGTCPAGYQFAGRWKPYPNKADGGTEISDYKGQTYDWGWATLCSADSAAVYVGLAGDDCGGQLETCGGAHHGQWHVGDACSAGAAAYDKNGAVMVAGWVTLCVEGSREVKVEIGLDDCGGGAGGCGSWPVDGQWHVGVSCSGGVTGGGDDGSTIKAGWMHMCVAQ